MCISAEASFAVGASLGVTGIATLRCAGAKPLPRLAAVSVLFAAQPGAEGVVWVVVRSYGHANGFRCPGARRAIQDQRVSLLLFQDI
jgi:hypothetical protein